MHTACVHAYFVCVLYGYVLDLAKDSMSSTGPGRQLYDYAYQSLGRSPEHLACRTHQHTSSPPLRAKPCTTFTLRICLQTLRPMYAPTIPMHWDRITLRPD